MSINEKNCQKNHSIEFNSIKNGETFNHRVILISGSVKEICSQNEIKVKVNSDLETVEKIESGKFKFLVRLLSAESESDGKVINNIEIGYCRLTTKLELYCHENSDSSLTVVPLYIINSGHTGNFQTIRDDDQNTQENACKRIDLSMELIQLIISEKLLEAGFSRKTFVLKECQVFQSSFDVEYVRGLTDSELYDLLAQEIYETKGKDACSITKFVGFLSCTQFMGIFDEDRSYTNMNSKTKANPSLGGSFLCLLGTGCFFAWPESLANVVSALMNETKIDVTQVRDDSNYRHTYAGCYSTTLGSLCHELCHTFDLGHTLSGIMGKDFDFIGRFFLTKTLTENIPERRVIKCQNFDSNQIQNKINPNCQKLTKIRKPGQFLEKYHQQKSSDMTFFESNCCFTLFYHKWFNPNNLISSSLIKFNMEERTVETFNSNLKLVELRELDNSVAIKFWSFLKSNITAFKIPNEYLLENVTLFAIDDHGETLKEKF